MGTMSRGLEFRLSFTLVLFWICLYFETCFDICDIFWMLRLMIKYCFYCFDLVIVEIDF